ncbi:hypothetical protein [Streptomyces antibioticus]|uniref:hypothetical protein n=1 Tax=Streptomyces antibioticus TaxID=1890 RepID=UPI003D709497
MPRPTDWSALGMGGDPTPGDPDRIDDVVTSQNDLVTLADTIDDGLTAILDTTDGVFVGKTADALRKIIDEDLRHYVSTFRQAHTDVQGALRTYVGVMRSQQQRADDALAAATALPDDDEDGREAQKSIAEDARSQLDTAAATAATALREAAYSIASPIDECEEFWKALGWLALILVIPAMIVGGPLALFAIGLNVALLIKTAIDFSQGKAGITELVLSIIGVIAPTTKGMRLSDLWKGLKGLGNGAFEGTRNIFRGANSFGQFGRVALGFDDVFAASGNWLRGLNGLKGLNGIRFTSGFRFMPGAKGFTMGTGGLAADFRFVPAAVGLTVINLAGARTFFALRTVMGALNGIGSVGTSIVRGMVTGLRNTRGLGLFLPVAADEVGRGLTLALKIGVIDRGVFGMYRYGAFAGGQFLGTASQISGGVAHGLALLRPGSELGSLGHVNLAHFTPDAGGGVGSGLGAMPRLSMADSMGSVNLSGFNGLGHSLQTSMPHLGAKIVDVPAGGALGAVHSVHLPTLGPVSAVSAPGLNGLHVSAAGTDVGAMGTDALSVPHLGAHGAGRLDSAAVGGLGAVHTPSVGNLGAPTPAATQVPAPAQVNAGATGQISVPSLGSVAQGPVVARLDTPAAGARVADMPPVGGAGRVDVPVTGQISVPLPARSGDLGTPTAGRVDVPSITRGGEVSAPGVSRVEVPAVARTSEVSAPPAARVSIPAVGGTGDLSGPAVVQADVTAVGRTGDGAAPAVGRGDLPGPARPGSADASAPSLAAPGAHSGRQLTGAGPVNAPALTAGTGHGGPAAPHAVDAVTHVEPRPAATPAKAGTLSGFGSGSPVMDLYGLGRVDLTALARQTVRVHMMTGTLLDLQHTFTHIDDALPGVRVEVRPGTSAGVTAEVDLANPHNIPNLTARYESVNGRHVLRVEQVLDGGTTHRWSYELSAPHYARIGDMQVIPPGGTTGSRVELMPLGGTSGAGAGAPAAVPVPPAPRTVEVPGIAGTRVQVEFGATPGGIGRVSPVADGTVAGPPPSVTLRAGQGPGGADLVRVEQTVSAVEVRTVELIRRGEGLQAVSDTRVITLAGGEFRGSRIAVDMLDGQTVRHVPEPGVRGPAGALGMVESQVRVPTGSGFQLYDTGTGLPTRAGLRLDDGTGVQVHVLPTADGRSLRITDAQGAPATATGLRVTPLTGGGFRVEYGGTHVVVGPSGAHTHDAVALQGTGHYAHRPTTPGQPLTRVDLHGTDQGPITLHNNAFHIPTTPHRTRVHDTTGTHTHDLLDINHPHFHNRPLHLTPDNTPTLTGATVTPQTNGGYRIHDGPHHIVTTPDGTPTHHAVALQGTGHYAHRPTTPGQPLTRVDLHGTDQGPITLHNNAFHIPTTPHRTRVHDTTGTHTHDLLDINHPHFHNRPLHLTPDNTPTLTGATVTPQTNGGYRIHDGPHHIVTTPDGTPTHHVTPLADTPHFVFRPEDGSAGVLRSGDGSGVPGSTLFTRADGHHVVSGPNTLRLHTADGATESTAVRLSNGDGLRTHPGGGLELRNHRMEPVDGATVTATPGGHRITYANGDIRLFDAAGQHRYTVAPPADGTHARQVGDAGGAPAFQVVELTDGVGTRFVRTDTHVLLDGDLSPVPSAHHTFTRTTEGGYRLEHTGPGARRGEYKVYDADGRITGQRINVVDRGTPKPNEYLAVTHPTDGVTRPSWERVRLDAGGTPSPAPATRTWFDSGTVDTKGLGEGRIRLNTHSGVAMMERRPLPGGNTLDAYHSSAGVGSFGRTSQRGVWTEFDAGGGVVRSGTRHWGESGRSWFDVTGSGSLSTRVRHFQENPDGGHVLARLDSRPVTQSFSPPTSWTRFDGEFKRVADGTRHWGPGRGFSDTMVHPLTGERVLMHEKFGRFTWSVDDVRRYRQTEVGADGVPTRNYTSWSPHGKENGRGVTLKNGGFLDSVRFAEQRPPVFFRWAMSSEYRAANLNDVPWLARDNRLQMHTWSETAADGTVTSGVRFVSNNATTTDVARAGGVVRETGKRADGTAVKVGDVELPDGVNRADGVLPMSHGDDIKGHRTYRTGDFTPLPPRLGDDLPAVRWQERVTDDLADGDWYSPNGAKQWRVVRVGLDDGSVLDFRPAPGAPGRTAHLGEGDWTRYDHHGLVVSRQDTWPDPAGGNPLRVTSVRMLDGNVRWTDSLGDTGVRKINHQRGDVTPWGWDRESYQDFDATGALVRDRRLLSDGTFVDSWRTGPDGNRVWHWNKSGADGAVRDFGTGTGDRVRTWFDGTGNRLDDWRTGARFEDRVTSLNGRVVQEIPARPEGTPWLADSPHRVREYLQNPGDTFTAHAWKEYENGIELGRKTELPDGTFLESEDWHKQWRRFGRDGVTLIEERTISGNIWRTDFLGRPALVGRETHFTGIFNEYRGYSRMWREPNRWEWGHTHNGVSTYTPFVNRAARAVLVDMAQEWILDFTMNLAVYGIVAGATGTSFGWNDVAKAAFGATVSAGVKGGVAAAHFSVARGGPWKTGLSQIDQGNPYLRRPNDDSWSAEFAGNEKVTRWRSGTYDFGVGVLSGAVSGFISGSATAAIFGVKDKDGNTHYLRGGDAAMAGLLGMAGGVAGAVSLGAARTALTLNLGGRWYHRQGFFDIFAVGGLGKLADKSFAHLYLTNALRESANPSWYRGSGEQPAGETTPDDQHDDGGSP